MKRFIFFLALLLLVNSVSAATSVSDLFSESQLSKLVYKVQYSPY
jgi:hypothetical protein